jgi:hypothetical protein
MRPTTGSEEGTALLLALTMLTAIGAGTAMLVPLAITERRLSAAAREGAECRYAAEGLLVYVMAELQRRPAWDTILDGSAAVVFAESTRRPRIGGRAVDLDAIGAALPGFEPGGWGPDAPRWVLVAWGPARALDPRLSSPIHVAAWAADDEGDGDGDSRRDANGRLLLHAEAFGPMHGRRAVRALVARRLPAPAPLRVLDWRWP